MPAQVLEGPMGTAFHLRDDYHGFAAQPFTPPLASTTMVELSGAPGHTFRLQFPARIKDPVLHLGSLASALSFTDAIAVTLVSGDQHFEVNGSTVSGQLAGSSDSKDGHDPRCLSAIDLHADANLRCSGSERWRLIADRRHSPRLTIS